MKPINVIIVISHYVFSVTSSLKGSEIVNCIKKHSLK